jgi:hypothetical protein
MLFKDVPDGYLIEVTTDEDVMRWRVPELLEWVNSDHSDDFTPYDMNDTISEAIEWGWDVDIISYKIVKEVSNGN